MIEPLYHSDRGVYPFQADGVGECYYDLNPVSVWDAGIGKTHLAMILACLLFEDGLIDRVLVSAEVNKVMDWVADFGRFTKLHAQLYHGSPDKRAKIRADLPEVLVGSYETIKNDAAHKGATKQSAWVPGPLLDAIEKDRTLVVYDECTKLRERSRDIYRSHACMVYALRRMHPNETRVLGLTATPIEGNPEQAYNFGRIIKGTDAMGTVENWNTNYVVSRDLFEKPIKFKNIGPTDHVDRDLPTLRDRLSPIIKRKTDPDVAAQFPNQVEEFSLVKLGAKQAAFYRALQKSFSEIDYSGMSPQQIEMEERTHFSVLRLAAGYPLALSTADGKLAREITEQVGIDGLRALGSAKKDELLRDLELVVRGQGSKMVVFTYYAHTILPLLHDDMRNAGYDVVLNHGGMSPRARQDSIEAFRYGHAQIFLSSDAGSKGLNLPEALYVENFELPLTHANYIQRINRNNRIDSDHLSVTCRSHIALDTIEEGIRGLMLTRNDWHDTLVADEDESPGFISADDRRALIQMARDRLKIQGVDLAA